MMSSRKNGNLYGKLQTVADLENAAIGLEKNITNLNKSFLRQLLKGFASLINILERKEPGIFSTVIRWYRLYLRVQISIDPSNEKLINQFEKTVPTAITYIIGCLQHMTKEIQNYHYSLLEILEELLENVKPNVFEKIINFETGTIACLWNPIDYAGDYNTQLKALKILSMFLKHFDSDKQNEELKSIKWTSLNFFQDKLKTIIQESKLFRVFDNTARELLNNFNMNLSKNVRVYSFNCISLILGTKYKFYKPLNNDKFWIDINYCPQTLSFNGRFKLDSTSKYELINVILKIQNIKIENKQVLIKYHKPGEFSKYSKEISAVSENFIQLTLNHEEEQRLRENHFVLDYFNKGSENPPSRSIPEVFQKSYNLITGSLPNETTTEIWVESPKTSTRDTLQKQPIRKRSSRKRKFFLSLLEEEFESDEEPKKQSKKISKVKKSRQPKTVKRQICKVSPIVDLTEIDDIPSKENVQKSSGIITDDLNNGDEKCIPSADLLTSQQCSNILKNVSDIYNVGDTTYAEPCQSYRNFKTQRVSGTVKNSIDKKAAKPRGRKAKKEASNVENITSNKENIDPILKSVKNVKRKNSSSNDMHITSPNLFGTTNSEEELQAPKKKLRSRRENSVYTTEIEIDLTTDDPIIIEKPLNPKSSMKESCTINQLPKSSSYEYIVNDDLLDYEDVRFAANPIAIPTAISTPNISKTDCSNNATPTSMMFISDINDSDMELTEIMNKSNYTMENLKNKELRPEKEPQNVVEKILNDWISDDDDESIQNAKDREQCCTETNILESVNNNDENVPRKCVVFQKRNEESDSSDNDDIDKHCETHPSINFLKEPDFMINKDFVIMQNKPLNLNTSHYNLDNIWDTPDKNNMIVRNVSTENSTECQVTPNTLILRQIQVSTKEAVLVADMKQKHQYQNYKAKKSLNDVYNNRNVSSNHQSSIKGILLKQTNAANVTGRLDNNNNIICPYGKPPKRTYLALKTKEKRIETSNSQTPLSNNNFNITNVTTIVPYNKALNACTAVETMEYSNAIGKELIHLKNNNSISLNIYQCNEATDKQPNADNSENALKASSPTKTVSLQENYNTNENINFKNSFLYPNSISYDEPGTLDTTDNYNNEIETNAEERSSQRNNYSPENVENLNNNSIYNVISLFSDENNIIDIDNGANSESENNQERIEKDLSELVDDLNTRMKTRIDNARRLCLTNTADLYVQKVREITETVLKKSEEQKKELEQLRKNIERLVTQMEWQYQIFKKKSELYDNYKKITERSLDALAQLNFQHRITSEYKELANQLKMDENDLLQEVWQDFVAKKREAYLNNMDNLSKI